MPEEQREPRPHLDRDPKEQLPEKQVSSTAYARLGMAADAIAATKQAIAHQGNQVPALQATKMNSRYRLHVMRDDRCWEFTTNESAELARENPEALIAAQADLAHGGNCGEHAWVAYHYLRLHAKGQPINLASKSGLDHAFVIIGNLASEQDNEMAVSDPWVNDPYACLWEDHFAHTPDRTKINARTMVADGNSYKAAIAAGLRLSAFGQQILKREESEETTQRETVDKREENHYWNHSNAAKSGHEYDYQPESEQEHAPPQQQDPEAQQRQVL